MSTKIAWTVEGFQSFWSDPNPAFVAAVLTEDVVGYWPGSEQPVVGPLDYTARIAQLLDLLPGMRLEVAEHAANGEWVFIRWVLHAHGVHGAFELCGIDRVVVRDGLVAENRIVFDTAEFETKSGCLIPWMR